jgi:hypothetical protein
MLGSSRQIPGAGDPTGLRGNDGGQCWSSLNKSGMRGFLHSAKGTHIRTLLQHGVHQAQVLSRLLAASWG